MPPGSIPARAPDRSPVARLWVLTGELGISREIVTVFLASRALVVLAALVAEYVIPRNPALTSGASGPILRSLTSWDGWWYLGIAHGGYHAEPIVGAYRDVAFLPLYPILVGVLSLPWPAFTGLVAVIVSNLAFLLALGLLVRLGEPYLGRPTATVAAGLLAVYPFASVFAMAYTESLFLLLGVAAFLASERRHRGWASVFLALAVLARFQGVALALPLWIIFLRQDAWRPRRSHLLLLLGPAAAAGWLAFVFLLLGASASYVDVLDAWGRSGLGTAAATETVGAKLSIYQVALLASLCWSVFLLVFVRTDRLRPEYWLVPVLFLASALASGTLESIGRYSVAAFPLVWLLAGRGSTLARLGWPIVSTGLFFVIATLTFGGYWVP
ncbi:MAG: mannosyltransferase family protein [Chloroflexota bacterium]